MRKLSAFKKHKQAANERGHALSLNVQANKVVATFAQKQTRAGLWTKLVVKRGSNKKQTGVYEGKMVLKDKEQWETAIPASEAHQ